MFDRVLTADTQEDRGRRTKWMVTVQSKEDGERQIEITTPQLVFYPKFTAAVRRKTGTGFCCPRFEKTAKYCVDEWYLEIARAMAPDDPGLAFLFFLELHSMFCEPTVVRLSEADSDVMSGDR